MAVRNIRIAVALVLGAALSGCGEDGPEVPPRQITTTSPFHYPEELWDAGVEGETVLRIYVDSVGRPDSALVERASGHAAFDSAALRGVPDLRFEPAQRDGRAVGAWVLIPVQFALPATDSVPDGAP